MVTLSIITPVCDGLTQLEQSLPPLLGHSVPELLEVIVVDDGSLDGSKSFALAQGATVLDTGGRMRGPAVARNIGARHARAEVLMFVDADVVVHEDAIDRMLSAFRDPDTTAVYGSYDIHPPGRGFASQYMNLRHHFYHQGKLDDAPTFWSGLGGVRRDRFLAVGGFDAVAYPRPSVEDIDLGRRLRAGGGRIRRDPSIQGTHLKRWSIVDVLRTDVLRRAVPWAKLIIRHPGAATDLNVTRNERLRAALAGLLLGTVLAAALSYVPFWIPLVLLALAGILSRRLIALFARANGVLFAVCGLLFHQLYYVYSAATYCCCLALFRHQRSGGE